MRENNIQRFDFSVEDTVTESNLLELFKNFKIESEYEFTYRKTDIVVYESLISSQYDIVKIDLDLIKIMMIQILMKSME